MPITIPPQFLNTPKTGFSLPGGYPGVPALPPGLPGLGPPPIQAATQAGIMQKLLASPLGKALGLVTAGTIADPGSGGFDPFLGINPNTEPDDLGITSLLKGSLRGFAGTGNAIADTVDTIGEYSPFFNLPEYLLTTESQRDRDKVGVEQAQNAEGYTPPAETPESLEYAIPGLGGDTGGSELDSLLAVVAGQKPKKGGVSDELKRDLLISSALGAGAETEKGNYGKWGSLLEGIAKGYKQQAVDVPLEESKQEQEYQKNVMDWLEKYARTGIDVEKEKRQAKKDDFKIHSTKNGFLVEMNDKEGNKVLRPINPFGGGTLKIGGSKFQGDNPLSTELGVLQNLADVGILNDVMVEHNKELLQSTKGLTDEKQIEGAKILTLARAMHGNPQFKAMLLQRYEKAMGSKAPGGSLWNSPAQADTSDWLEGLSQ